MGNGCCYLLNDESSVLDGDTLVALVMAEHMANNNNNIFFSVFEKIS